MLKFAWLGLDLIPSWHILSQIVENLLVEQHELQLAICLVAWLKRPVPTLTLVWPQSRSVTLCFSLLSSLRQHPFQSSHLCHVCLLACLWSPGAQGKVSYIHVFSVLMVVHKIYIFCEVDWICSCKSKPGLRCKNRQYIEKYTSGKLSPHCFDIKGVQTFLNVFVLKHLKIL